MTLQRTPKIFFTDDYNLLFKTFYNVDPTSISIWDIQQKVVEDIIKKVVTERKNFNWDTLMKLTSMLDSFLTQETQSNRNFLETLATLISIHKLEQQLSICSQNSSNKISDELLNQIPLLEKHLFQHSQRHVLEEIFHILTDQREQMRSQLNFFIHDNSDTLIETASDI